MLALLKVNWPGETAIKHETTSQASKTYLCDSSEKLGRQCDERSLEEHLDRKIELSKKREPRTDDGNPDKKKGGSSKRCLSTRRKGAEEDEEVNSGIVMWPEGSCGVSGAIVWLGRGKLPYATG
jgi:hypothetical protein